LAIFVFPFQAFVFKRSLLALVFQQFGTVNFVKLVLDNKTGKSKGCKLIFFSQSSVSALFVFSPDNIFQSGFYTWPTSKEIML
jgi:RNA recognition motif-containing protein